MLEKVTHNKGDQMKFTCFNTTDDRFSVVRLILISSIIFIASCGGGGGGDDPIPATNPSIQVSWNASLAIAVNRPGGGYKVYYSTNSGFNPGDGGVTEIDVPYSSGVLAPTSVVISVSPGTYYIRIVAYSALNAPGTSGGSTSTVTPQITLTAP